MADNRADDRFAAAIAAWVGLCQRRAGWVLLATSLLSVLAGFYLAANMRIDTDTENMLSAELPFRQNAIALDKGFPQFEDNLLVVLEAPNADAADDGAARLTETLRGQPAIFSDVFSSRADPFLRRHGLLFLKTDALEALSTRLAAAQPFLGTLWRAPNLDGLADMVGLLGKAGSDNAGTLSEAGRVLGQMADVAESVRSGKPAVLVWSDLILGTGDAGDGPVRRLITVRPALDFDSLQPAARATEAVLAAARKLGLTMGGYQVRLTGSAALADDELKSVEKGMGIAGLVSLVLVTLVLIVGLRSFGMMVSLIIALVVGLVWTAAFAIFAVGALNLISVAFAVLFVGLSVDFGIHFSLRATEHVNGPGSWPQALVLGGHGAGTSLALCAVTSAIAFFSFLPTSYVGLAELGLIAGSGMFIAFAVNFTVLPALLRLLVRKPPRNAPTVERGGRVHEVMRVWARPIVAAVLVSALAAAWFAKDARFDFDPMNLKDPDAPSVRALFDLADSGAFHPYSADVLSDNMDDAKRLIVKLRALPGVSEVQSLSSLIPADQDAKLGIIGDMALFLGPAFYAQQGTVAMDDAAVADALARLQTELSAVHAMPGMGDAAKRLADALAGLDSSTAKAVNGALFSGLPARLETLIEALEAEPVSEATLPDQLKSRYVTADGKVRIEIQPATDLRDLAALRAFVTQVESVAPNATGAPVVVVEAGKAVLFAFAEALTISLVFISLVVWLVLRRVTDVLLVFAPVFVAAVWTLAVSAIFDVPFNFANVIVLPLLFGLSVDFGVHLVLREREAAKGAAEALTTTTPRAVLLSALTTLGSFSSIMLSGHPGTASMGLLLTIAIGLSLTAIMVFLPALLNVLPMRRG